MEQDRLYRQHLKAIALMKPSIDSHHEPLKKFQRKDKIVRVFEGAKVRHAPRIVQPDSESTSARSEPAPSQPQSRPATAIAKVAPAPRRAVSARAVHSKLTVRDCHSEEKVTDRCDPLPIAPPGLSDPPALEQAVSFGADMWDTSDEMEEDQRSDSDCSDFGFRDC
jgi:hypothetical protein